MKNLLLTVIFLSLYFLSYSQDRSIEIYGNKIKSKDITGIKSFNDIGATFMTSFINDLTEDTIAYLYRLGSIRNEYWNYKSGTKDLFNLSFVNSPKGYPILDKIDFIYYRNWGFNLLEQQYPDLVSQANYLKFKSQILDYAREEKFTGCRTILWLDSNYGFRTKLLMTKYFFNKQHVKINNRRQKQLSLESKASAKSLLKTIFKKDSLHIGAYFKRQLDKIFKVDGNYISVCFQNEYVNTIVANMPTVEEIHANTDEFSKNLALYLDPKDTLAALNSAIFVFQFSGSIDKTISDSTGIRALLDVVLPDNPSNASIAATISLGFSRSVSRTFSNQFSKVWVTHFGTHKLMNELGVKELMHRTDSQLKMNEDKEGNKSERQIINLN